jgi:hypothetical protein
MASYTWTQLSGSGVYSTERFNPEAEAEETVKLSIVLPATVPNADTSQCALIIETLNLGFNPTVGASSTSPPFGQNPTIDYFDAGYSGGNLVADFNAGASRGFTPRQAWAEEAPATIPTFESLGITHNLQLIPGATAGVGEEGSRPLQVAYLPQSTVGGHSVIFNMGKSSTTTTKVFYWTPTNDAAAYGGGRYGSVRFRGIGGISITTALVSKIAE